MPNRTIQFINLVKCSKCGTVWLRAEDKVRCESNEIETPIIEVGTVLIDSSYGVDTQIRCYAINQSEHAVVYSFEWDRDNSNRWEHLYTIKGNDYLGRTFYLPPLRNRMC